LPHGPLLWLYYLLFPLIGIYRFIAVNIIRATWLLRIYKMHTDKLYWERVSRNIGWIRKADQTMLRKCIVGIAGCGGMGGLLAVILVRLGVGEVRIADNEAFDITNLNRQYGATLRTLGLSKAIETARILGWISRDTHIVVYPEGIVEETAADFVNGCDLICDEIEFWAVASRILLHMYARQHDVDILCAPTVGFAVFIFLFTKTSRTVEQLLDMHYDEAVILQDKLHRKIATKGERRRVMRMMLRYAAPYLPEYSKNPEIYSTAEALRTRLLDEGTASIISTNPPMAAGLLANHVLFYLLKKKSDIEWTFVAVPPRPGFLMYDAGHHEAKIVIDQFTEIVSTPEV